MTGRTATSLCSHQVDKHLVGPGGEASISLPAAITRRHRAAHIAGPPADTNTWRPSLSRHREEKKNANATMRDVSGVDNQ